MHIELLVGGSVADRVSYEPKDVGGTDGSSGTDQREKSTLKWIAPLTNGVSVDLQCQYRSQNNGVESTIKGHTFTYERYI
jgi:hypothetical protein